MGLVRAYHALALAGALSACNLAGTSPLPAPRDETRAASVEVTAQSPQSAEARSYYAGLQQKLLIQGLLRTDGGGADTPFSGFQLEENFIRLALYEELVLRNGLYRDEESATRLRRWEAPVRLSLEFSSDVPLATRARDTGLLRRYAARLGAITGHPVRLAGSDRGANFHVAVLSVDALADFGPRLRVLLPGLAESTIGQITTLPREINCTVLTFDDPAAPNRIGRALAIIRAEHPNLMRDACFHEEVAQGLGLFNDSARARPSIFNDDEEFALLTRHDELLLQLLYDARLRPGMSAETARPVLRAIIPELLGSAS